MNTFRAKKTLVESAGRTPKETHDFIFADQDHARYFVGKIIPESGECFSLEVREKRYRGDSDQEAGMVHLCALSDKRPVVYAAGSVEQFDGNADGGVNCRAKLVQ